MKYILGIILGGMILSVASCTKCTVCTKSGSTDVRLCEKDYNSNTAYGVAVDAYEYAGYNCYKSF